MLSLVGVVNEAKVAAELYDTLPIMGDREKESKSYINLEPRFFKMTMFPPFFDSQFKFVCYF